MHLVESYLVYLSILSSLPNFHSKLENAGKTHSHQLKSLIFKQVFYEYKEVDSNVP